MDEGMAVDEETPKKAKAAKARRGQQKMALDGVVPQRVKPPKMKRGQRSTKQQRRKLKNVERALAVAARTSTKLSKGGSKEARKKAAKGLY